MNKPAKEIAPLYPFILVKPLFEAQISDFGIEVAGAPPVRIPVEVEVVAHPEELGDESANPSEGSRFLTHAGEHIFVRKFSSPETKDGNYFVHEEDVMAFRREE